MSRSRTAYVGRHASPLQLTEPGWQYIWGLTTAASPGSQAVYALAKARLPALVDAVFRKFPATMLEVHGKDLTVNGSADPSRAGTPKPTESRSAAAAAPKSDSAKAKVEPKKNTVNTKTITVEGNFAASADDLFDLLTNEKRIPMWTRAPAQVSSSKVYLIVTHKS